MEASTRSPGYDLFKLIVAIVLLILFLILLRVSPPQSVEPASTTLSASPLVTPSALSSGVDQPPNSSPTPSPALVSETSVAQHVDTATPAAISSSAALSATTQSEPSFASSTSPAPTVTQSPVLSPTETKPAEPTPSSLPSPTGTSVPEPTATPVPETAVASACDEANSVSRLRLGMSATILRRLNFRSSPGIRDNWLLTNRPGTQVEVIGGPECIPYWTGAYVWWQIKLPDGRVGWSAEGSLHGSFYFVEPLK